MFMEDNNLELRDDEIIAIVEGEAIIQDAEHFSYRKTGLYNSLRKLQRQVSDSTKSTSNIDREVFVKRLQSVIVDTIVLVMKSYHTNLDSIKYNLLLDIGENLNVISIYVESLLNVGAINEKKYTVIKEIFDNALTHYSKWFSSFNFKINRY